MSKLLTVLFTASKSSARRAPISYTPPVKPPPPSTSAVLSRRGRRRRSIEAGRPTPLAAMPLERALPADAAFFRLGSSLTTLPIPNILGPRAPETPRQSADSALRNHAHLLPLRRRRRGSGKPRRAPGRPGPPADPGRGRRRRLRVRRDGQAGS